MDLALWGVIAGAFLAAGLQGVMTLGTSLFLPISLLGAGSLLSAVLLIEFQFRCMRWRYLHRRASYWQGSKRITFRYALALNDADRKRLFSEDEKARLDSDAHPFDAMREWYGSEMMALAGDVGSDWGRKPWGWLRALWLHMLGRFWTRG